MSSGKIIVLSKSRLMRGMQCNKNLFFTVFTPDLEAPVDPASQARFDEGKRVGELARDRFPGGVLIQAEAWDYSAAAKLTQQVIASGELVIFEASFLVDGYFVRIDVLHREEISKPWQITEVKSSTSVKDEHVDDVAIQLLVARRAGIDISLCNVMFIDNRCLAPNLQDLFISEDITDRVAIRLPEIESKVVSLFHMIGNKQQPEQDIGPHCGAPYECSFKNECWKDVPVPSVFDIPRIGKKAWKLRKAGNVKISDLVFGELSGASSKFAKVLLSGKRWIDNKKIGELIAEWIFPLYFLDFETVNWAIPVYSGTKPFQQIPFQFSCHVLCEDGTLNHHEYLHREHTDPRSALAHALADSIGTRGSVVAYNATFEATVLKQLVQNFPELSEPLTSMVDRLVDPLKVFQTAVYDPKFLGSFSIKSVAPAILGDSLSYDLLKVKNGNQAQDAYLKLISLDLIPTGKKALVDELLAYCRQDTFAMVELVKWLFKESEREATKRAG